MSYLFCDKSVSGLGPLENTLLTNANRVNECEYHITIDTLKRFGWISNNNITLQVGYALNNLISMGIIKSFEYTFLANNEGPEILIYCNCDKEYSENKK
jgi:hypothetical protein